MKIPAPFWCYFLPMLAASLGLLPHQSPVYSFISAQLLPVCLALLLIGTDLKAMGRMGFLALFVMGAGAAGTMAGGLISFWLYRRWLPPEAWGGIGALTGSWIGGSANMIAVKEALRVPDRIIGPLIIVDAAVAYSWMALLIWSSSLQEKWDTWLGKAPAAGMPGGARREAGAGTVLASSEVLSGKARERGRASSAAIPRRGIASGAKPGDPPPGRPPGSVGGRIILLLLFAITLSFIAQWVGHRLPAGGAVFSPSVWTVVIVTTVSLLLSLTPARRLEQAGASKIGTLLLYVLLVSIGARADLKAILQTPVFLAVGITWILIHGACLLLAGRIARAPLGLIAAASQANIGGVVSAPIVGATFSAELAGLGLLMAVLGNVLGTYLGLAAAFAARRLAFVGA